MKLSAITDSVLSLFIMILVGVYGSKKKIITSQINKGLTDILVQIALPFMIVSSFIFTYDHTIKTNIVHTFYYSPIAYIVIIAISYLLLLPIKNDKKTILHFANVFTNTGYVGFPILYSIYGNEGVIYGSIFNMFFVIFVWTYGLMLFKDFKKKEFKKEIRNVLLNPSIIAIYIGIVIMVFNIRLPNALISSMKSIGNMTGPLSMFIIGVILSNIKIRKYLKDWTIYYGIITKLVIIPIIIYFISILLVDLSKAVITVIIMTAMPASTMTSIFAESYDKQKEYAALLVSITTLLSLISVPILLKMIIS
ncbi:MAG: AEC family transporter [Clostridiales bacterium]|nr:AEC family transporter [Clostridiales bacterium]